MVKPHPPNLNPLLTVAAAAEYSGFCRNTIYRRIAGGALPATRFGRSWRIALADLDRWLASGDQL